MRKEVGKEVRREVRKELTLLVGPEERDGYAIVDTLVFYVFNHLNDLQDWAGSVGMDFLEEFLEDEEVIYLGRPMMGLCGSRAYRLLSSIFGKSVGISRYGGKLLGLNVEHDEVEINDLREVEDLMFFVGEILRGIDSIERLVELLDLDVSYIKEEYL